MSVLTRGGFVVAAMLFVGCGSPTSLTSTCTDGVKNGNETDIDCGGGTCGPCGDGMGCIHAGDCKGGTCLNGTCGSLPASCADTLKDGDETDVDCGGKVCSSCADGKKCIVANDCMSKSCTSGSCQPSSCKDMVKNGGETDVDCGGATCPKCGDGKMCLVTADCSDGVCLSGVCSPSSCQDGIKNGSETDVDCGGMCPKCATGKSCGGAMDCQSDVCTGGKCAAATCMDMVQNGNETDVDCGGSCPACAVGKMCVKGADCVSMSCFNGVCASASCVDNLKDNSETDVDCGGGQCPTCANGKMCLAPSDCTSGVCTANVCIAASCMDTVKNGMETDVDCGGGTCPGCVIGKMCILGTDCVSNLCLNGLCVPPSCGDGVKNEMETDIDCGGPCMGCVDGKMCLVNNDCIDGVCGMNVCQPPTCMDKIKNGQETDIDCGGPMCPACPTNGGCKVGKDCLSNICVNSMCQVPSCMDGVKNGNETDIDCGGMCPACGVGKGCLMPGDCWDGICGMGGKCGSSASVTVGGGMNPPLNPMGDGSKLVVLDMNGNITVNRASSLLSIARYLYVSNSGEGTVSKIDPSTFKEVGRYCTAPGCNSDPSRASVSLDGDAGVANRATYFYNSVAHPERASAVKIAGDPSRCIDRNGNGVIDTFSGSGPIPQQFMWPQNTTISPDECVLWWTPLTKDRNGNVAGGLGTLPRSATFDAKPSANGATLSSNFYVGLFGTNELVQLDAVTGAIKQQVSVPGAPYSSVIDHNSFLWIRDSNTSRIIKVDTTTPNLTNAFLGPASPCGYAISADSRGYIYSAGSNCISRMDPTQNVPSWESLVLPNACFPRGPSIDANFNLWVPDTCYGGYRVNASAPFGGGLALIKAIPLVANSSAYFLGTAIDGNAIPYFINTETGNLQQVAGPNGTVYKVDWTNNYAVSQIRVGASPYVYSDLSGSQLALTAPTTGSFRKTFQPFCGAKATWTTLTYVDTVPLGTTLTVQYRAAADANSLLAAPFVTAGTEPPALAQPINIALPMGTNPSFFQVQFTIATASTQNKPTLGSVTVNYTCPQ